MNPQHNEQSPDFNLPPPQVPTEAVASMTERQNSQAIEQGSSLQNPMMPAPQAVSSTIPNDRQIIPVEPSSLQQSQASNTTPQIADDADLIEKEWVLKAKEIVNQTKVDPFAQSKEISKVRADYIKKRYNKDIKLSED